jgi:hypothetical protein
MSRWKRRKVFGKVVRFPGNRICIYSMIVRKYKKETKAERNNPQAHDESAGSRNTNEAFGEECPENPGTGRQQVFWIWSFNSPPKPIQAPLMLYAGPQPRAADEQTNPNHRLKLVLFLGALWPDLLTTETANIRTRIRWGCLGG